MVVCRHLYFILNTFRNWESVECSKDRSGVISFIITENEMGSIVLNMLDTMDGKFRKASTELQ